MPLVRKPLPGDIAAPADKEKVHPDDKDLYSRISEILGFPQPPLEKSSILAVVLYSDTFCPILKYHSQLISELAAAIPALLQKSISRERPIHPIQAEIARSPDTVASSASRDTSASVLTMILSPKSDRFIRDALAVPFQMDLFDRMRLARIQIAESFSHLEIPLLLDDSFGLLQDRNKLPFDKSQPNQSIQLEAKRLQSILARVAMAHDIDALELVTILEQSQTDLYGIPVDLPGKIVYVTTRRIRDKTRKASRVRWVDRVFLKAGYSPGWIAANLLTVYVQTDTERADELEEVDEGWGSDDSGDEDEIQTQLEGALETEEYPEAVIYLSDMRPKEAKVRVMAKQNRGERVFEPGVLAQVQRSKMFEMQAIRKPRFTPTQGASSLGNSTGHHARHLRGNGSPTSGDDNRDGGNGRQAPSHAPVNPFL